MIFPRLDTIATPDVVALDGHASVDLALEAMCAHRIRDVVVRLEDGSHRILLATDLVDCQGSSCDYTTRLDQLPLHELPTLPPEANAMEGIERLRDGGEYLALLDADGGLCGIVSYSDLLASIDPESLAQARSLGDLLAGAHITRVDAGESVSTVLQQMRQTHQSAVLIEAGGTPRGIFTRSDVVRLLAARQSLAQPIGELVSHPLVTVPEHYSVQQALVFCREQGFKRIVVSDAQGAVIAMITQRELVTLFYSRWSRFMQEQEAQLRRLNADLSVQKRRLELITREMGDGLVVLDPDGCIEQINPAAQQLLALNAAEALGRPAADFFRCQRSDCRTPLLNCDESDPAATARLLDGDGFDGEQCLRRRDGTLLSVEMSCRPLHEAGAFVGSVLVFRDTAEHQRMVAALRGSNADLEQFAYSVSHDMRQPLRMVSGHLQVLARSLEGRLDDEERESLDFALDGARRMDAMIVSLLDYSRVGRKTRPKQEIASRDSLEEALHFLEPEIEASGAQIESSGEWPRLHASRDELSRLLQNLIGNAIKYQDGSRPVEVRVVSAVEGGWWRLVVEDNGIGIEPSELPRLFRFFSRLHTSNRYQGTGMGLALCRRIVEHHGGTLRAESEGAGHGSRFLVEIPLESGQERG